MLGLISKEPDSSNLNFGQEIGLAEMNQKADLRQKDFTISVRRDM